LRAMRIDKLSLLALEAVLEQYLNNDLDKLPLWAMTQMPAEEIKARAEGWLAELGPELEGKVLPTFSTMGGGSLPGETIPSWALVLTSATYSAQRIYDWLRLSSPAVMGRIVQDKVWLDPRTVLPEQDREVVAILRGGIS
ncbi:MAG: L-seryl-tRNA(Sec) selenium transferase, partial [Limnochordia bacterium]